MIQPLKSNSIVSFGNKENVVKQGNTQQQTSAISQNTNVQNEPKVNLFEKVKTGFVNTIKSFNNVTNVGVGATRGIVEGAVAAGIVGVVGKNIKNHDGKIAGTIGGIAKDSWSAIKVLPKAIKNLWINSPKDNIVTLFKKEVPSAFKSIRSGLKRHKATTALAVVAGVVTAFARTIQGKVKANVANSNIDHITNRGHI